MKTALFTLCLGLQSQAAFALDWDTTAGEPPTTAARTLSELANRPALSVFWWNIHNGKINGAERGTNESLTRNLDEIASSAQAPDVITLAEFRQASLSANTSRILAKRYPYQVLSAEPGTPGYGIAIVSRFPMDVVKTVSLDFTPLAAMTPEQRASYRRQWCEDSNCRRTASLLRVKTDHGDFLLATVHLIDAWKTLEGQLGLFRTLQELALGTNDPIYFQMLRLKDFLQSALPQGFEKSRLVLVGDFNLPSNVLHLQPPAFRDLRQGLKNLAMNGAATFPARSATEAGHYPALQIDHALISFDLQATAAGVLQLKGSDHYPLWIDVSNP